MPNISSITSLSNLGSIPSLELIKLVLVRPQWEKKFLRWSASESQTETNKIERTKRMIIEAIKEDLFLSKLDIEIFIQGSYKNDTNVRGESDVDVCVLLKDPFYYDIVPAYIGAYHPDFIVSSSAILNPKSFKKILQDVLKKKLGLDYVTIGNKSIKVTSSSARVNADVVVAYLYKRFSPSIYESVSNSTLFMEGIVIYPENTSNIVVSWPKQHFSHGTNKNRATGNKFKGIVRILKCLNLEMESADYKPIPSFLIESLVYNCPNSCFMNYSYYDNVHSILNYISSLNKFNSYNWYEVNQIKALFDISQSWTIHDVSRFVGKALKKIETTP